MKLNFKKSICLIICAILISTLSPIKANANSAQAHWQGVDSTGAIFMGDNCPIVVTNEVLTLDIAEFPASYYQDINVFLKYSGKVTAEYTFYNPTDLTLTATLVFPFGQQPDYAYIYDPQTGTSVTNADVQKYDITVNGEAIEKNIRYTLKPSSIQFDLSEDLPRLSNTYIKDTFYSHEMTVTKCTYIVGGANKEGLIDKDKYRAANVAFDWDGGDGSSKIYFPEQSGFHTQDDGDGRFGMWAENGDIFSVYVIGQPLSAPFVMKCYKNGGVKDGEEIDGIVSLIDTNTMTLEDLALEGWSEETGITKVDWYNATIDAFKYGGKGNPKYNYVLIDSYGINISSEHFATSLMRWYEYTITLPPKESITNTVTAPLYPEIDLTYDPDVYSYTYLLSPASTWATFGELEININTPFYITESTLDGFTKTNTGYTLKLEGLPNAELEFSLSTSENPTKPSRNTEIYILAYILNILPIIGAVVVIGGVIAFVIIRKRKARF